MVQGTLVIETLRLMDQRKDSVISISRATGLDFWWLRKFMKRAINDPSVNRVQTLYEHLSGTKLLPDQGLHALAQSSG